MSSPIDPKVHKDPIRGAIGEISDAISALNMHPHPIPPHEQLPNNSGYLSQTDYWAEHAVEHLRAAMECLRIQGNCVSPAVDLLRTMLAAGQVSEQDAFNLICDIKDGNLTPGEERLQHMQYLKFRHSLEVEDE